jgi:large subunit ribosomal protein L23
MSQVRKNDHSLMKVLLGPVISEKATKLHATPIRAM